MLRFSHGVQNYYPFMKFDYQDYPDFFKSRCLDCYLLKTLCLCDRIPSLDISTQLVLIMHEKERKRSTNTGQLAARVWKNTEVQYRGRIGQKLDVEKFLELEEKAWFVYPQDGAQTLDRRLIEEIGKPTAIILPDGTWDEAARVWPRNFARSKVKKVQLDVKTPSKYQIRVSPHFNSLCTFETVIEIISVLEGEEHRAKLQEVFEIFVERTLWLRGKISRAECRYPLPNPVTASVAKQSH
jgi:DTW domain-containing protein YfiP